LLGFLFQGVLCKMKKGILLCLLLMVSPVIFSQSLTLQQLKALKNEFQADIIQLPDSVIVYPVTGLIHIDIKNSLKGETIVEVEVWVVDAKGKLVYNTIFAGKDLTVENFDADYKRYMRMQSPQLLKRRVALINQCSRNNNS
jgi:hypothetical protein